MNTVDKAVFLAKAMAEGGDLLEEVVDWVMSVIKIGMVFVRGLTAADNRGGNHLSLVCQ